MAQPLGEFVKLKNAARALARGLGYELVGVRRESFPVDPYRAQRRLMGTRADDALTILDVGANRGQTTAQYLDAFPRSLIHCFEPFPDSVEVLRGRFAENARVHIQPVAVSRENGHKTFYVNETDATNSLLPRPSSGPRYYPDSAGPKGTLTVPTVTLDTFVGSQQLAAVDILKFDIQGAS